MRLLIQLAALSALAGCAMPGRGPGGSPPPRYACLRVDEPITVDGRLDEAAWAATAWSQRFGDIECGMRPVPRYDTRMKMIWTDEALYVSARLEEPHVCASLTERDAIVYRDNDFEVFIDPDGDARNYGEVEVNALNTVMDLLMNRPYSRGGHYDLGWDVKGLETAVHVEGTLNDPTDHDTGWTVEMKLPWTALAALAATPCPPRPGDVWRISFSRVQWRYDIVRRRYVKVPNLREDNWTWTCQGRVDMHRPERWGVVEFAE